MREIQNSSRDAWLARRVHGLGASDAPVILGLSKYRSPFQLYHEKLGLAAADPAESEAAEWGLTLEAPLSARFERETGRLTMTPPAHMIYQHNTIDWLLASIDRWQHAIGPSGVPIEGWSPLELKTSNWALDKDWKEEAPLAYQVQLQHQLAVSGASMGSIAGLIGGQKFIWTDIQRDDAFIDILLAEEAKFWQRLLDHDTPPVDASEQTKQTLKRLYATETGEIVILGPDAIEWDNDLEAAKKAIKEWEEKERLAKNRFLLSIGAATVGALSNGVIYTLKGQTTREHTVKEATFRVLRRKAAK
jgi:putative phage-type endonuclease